MMQRRSLGEAPATAAAAAPHYDEFAIYTYSVDLTADQELLDQSISIDADSDFYLMALAGSSTDAYELRFKLPNGRYTSSGRIRNSLMIGTAQLPTPVTPFIVCPANSRLGIDIKDLSSAPNSVYLALRGFRRFKTR
jgi:hypothetical protein